MYSCSECTQLPDGRSIYDARQTLNPNSAESSSTHLRSLTEITHLPTGQPCPALPCPGPFTQCGPNDSPGHPSSRTNSTACVVVFPPKQGVPAAVARLVKDVFESAAGVDAVNAVSDYLRSQRVTSLPDLQVSCSVLPSDSTCIEPFFAWAALSQRPELQLLPYETGQKVTAYPLLQMEVCMMHTRHSGLCNANSACTPVAHV